MKIRMLAVLALFATCTATAFAQPPTTEQIEQIIATPPREALGVCFGNQRSENFQVCAEGPLQRIALAGREAKKAYKAFTLADVTDDMRQNVWVVAAQPSRPVLNAGRWNVTPAATEALFQPSGKPDAPVVRPVRFELTPMSWGNAMGAKFAGAGFTAYFNPADLPDGPLDLIILTTGKERRYTLDEKDRQRLK